MLSNQIAIPDAVHDDDSDASSDWSSPRYAEEPERNTQNSEELTQVCEACGVGIRLEANQTKC